MLVVTHKYTHIVAAKIDVRPERSIFYLVDVVWSKYTVEGFTIKPGDCFYCVVSFMYVPNFYPVAADALDVPASHLEDFFPVMLRTSRKLLRCLRIR